MKLWKEAVHEVNHDNECATTPQVTIEAMNTSWAPQPAPCNCSRDVRIAKGIEAVRQEALFDYGFSDEYGDPNVPVATRQAEYDVRTLAEHIRIFKEATV